MQDRTKLIYSVALVAAVLVAAPFVVRKCEEWQTIREEEALKQLNLAALQLNSSTLDEAMDVILKRVHALGHPEVRVCLVANGAEAPDFHASEGPRHPSRPGQTVAFSYGPASLEELLKYVSAAAGATCEIRGHDLVIVPARGTLEPFRRATLRLDRTFFDDYSDRDLAGWARAQGMTPYEGTTVKFKREQAEVEIFAPGSEIALLEASLGKQPRSDKWKQMEATIAGWRLRVFGF